MTDKQAQFIAKVVGNKLQYIYKKVENYSLAGEVETTHFSIGAATKEVMDLIKEDLTINNINSVVGVSNGTGYVKVRL